MIIVVTVITVIIIIIMQTDKCKHVGIRTPSRYKRKIPDTLNHGACLKRIIGSKL
jgi:hypothetical protein